jgi:signal transduction histidine kinase
MRRPGTHETGILARQRFLLLVTGVMVTFMIAGAYFIGRAIRSDLAVARMQSDFVSDVSHEFRTPLTSIRQLSELLALSRVPSESRRQLYYQTLIQESTRLQRLVEGLLNFGRMEAGVCQYRFEAVDAADLITVVTAEFESRVQRDGRHIELHAPSSPCIIEADPEAISVALRNLIDNALKYAPNCNVIRVECVAGDSEVAIRVCDRGPGVLASERGAIFRKFVRGSAAHSTNVRGSGVGLAMVRHLVSAHGGEVSLTSEPDVATVFTILLPLAQSAARSAEVIR